MKYKPYDPTIDKEEDMQLLPKPWWFWNWLIGLTLDRLPSGRYIEIEEYDVNKEE